MTLYFNHYLEEIFFNKTTYTYDKNQKTTISITPSKKGYCNISEINFFSAENETITGKVIGTECHQGGPNENTIDKVFDGDALTYYISCNPDSGWAGLDFGKPELISKIVYAPRNDDNYISKDNLYELF